MQKTNAQPLSLASCSYYPFYANTGIKASHTCFIPSKVFSFVCIRKTKDTRRLLKIFDKGYYEQLAQQGIIAAQGTRALVFNQRVSLGLCKGYKDSLFFQKSENTIKKYTENFNKKILLRVTSNQQPATSNQRMKTQRKIQNRKKKKDLC